MRKNENIIDKIGRAFPETTIDAADAFNDWGMTYPDATEYIEKVDGKTWRQVDAAWLVRRSDALGFLGTTWLAALMPVYLIAAVNDGVWSPATEMLVLILARPGARSDNGLGHKRFAALVDALTQQREAVADVLNRVAEIDPEGSLGIAALGALESCWNEFRKDGNA